MVTFLLGIADAYLAVKPIPDKTLSSRVFGDSKKLAALRAGGDLTTARYLAAIQWFAQNWPRGAKWPAVIERPELAA